MSESRSGGPADWIDLATYLAIQDNRLRQLEQYFVLEHNLHPMLDRDSVRIRGIARCQGGLTLQVNNILLINSRRQVRGARFRYHAKLADPPIRNIFRYDNAHRYAREGHPDEYHKHIWNHLTWQEVRPPAWIGRYHWPSLGEVLDELYDWWLEIGRKLAEHS